MMMENILPRKTKKFIKKKISLGSKGRDHFGKTAAFGEQAVVLTPCASFYPKCTTACFRGTVKAHRDRVDLSFLCKGHV